MPVTTFFAKRLFFNILLIGLFFYSFSSFAQTSDATLSVSFPTNRMVFQRNNENFGFINIMGNYTQSLDKIEAKLTPIAAGQGVATDWLLVQANPKAGYFAGKIQGQGGWYKMEIRGVKNDVVLKIITIEKVGIGEVFIALGQSNAQGISDSGAKGAEDDRVNTVNFFNENGTVPENLNFVQLSQNVDIAPHGTGPWCYGELGDRLVKRLNVPVMFFNAGFLGVSVINWRESAEGLPTFNFVLDVGGRFQYNFGIPYSNLKNTLNYYGSLLGVRSLLWNQGETDNSPNRLSADVYADNLQKVIDISRKDFDNDLTWMVTRTSLTYLTPSNPEIIGGQNKVINQAGNNVFAGPLTDNLQIPRPDNVHFKNVPPDNMGLSILAENWDKFLDNNFFQNSKPVLAKAIVEPQILCDTDNQAILKVSEIFKSIEWSNGSTSNQISVEKGEYSVALKDLQGNKYVSPIINTNLIYPKEKPVITNDIDLEFCTDGTKKVSLTAIGDEFKTFQWSSGETNQKIMVGNSGEFTVTAKNEFGCLSLISDKIVVTAKPTPEQPKIMVLPANNVCEGQNITLSTDSNDKILWSNNETTSAISFDKIGNYEVSLKVSNELGCVSSESILQKISINPTPKQPSVSQFGVFALQAITGDFLANDQFEWKRENTFFLTTSTPLLKIAQPGAYQVSTVRKYQVSNSQSLTCQSKVSDIFSFQLLNDFVSIYPNPATDLVYLETKEVMKNLDVRFYTTLGKQVYKFILDDTSERKEIDLRSLESGSYIIKIKGYGFEETKRLIIQSK
ncbi:T9SS type A sorting domain-containing protein [Emticicia sp. SJ17W-69]|uniref:T9SS type A sorting domain-containing protein n=1 Tax=Emticicia sp. SJ17W-69 TaxID=3421657 RepID=UPI003EB75B13